MIVFGSGLFIYYIIHFEPPRGRLKDDYRMTYPPRGVREVSKMYDIIYEQPLKRR